MVSAIAGAIVAALGGVSLWYFMPTHGKPHPYAKMIFVQTLIPVCIVSAFAIGVALIVAGIVGAM